MTETGVFDLLESITVGSVVAWILALVAIGVALYKAGHEIYKAVKYVKDVVDRDNNQERRIDKIESHIDNISDCMQCIQEALDEFREERIAEQRHTIVKSGEECLERGWISVRELRALCEIFEQYEKPGRDGVKHNGYVATLMRKVKALPVKGKLDEHGEDIEEVGFYDQSRIE